MTCSVHTSKLRVPFWLWPSDGFGPVSSSWPRCSGQGRYQCIPAARKSFVSHCGSNPPFNYCGTELEGVISGCTHDRADDCRVFGTLQAYLHISVRVCVCVFKCVLKGQGVWWKSALFELRWGGCAHVSTRSRLLLEVGDGAGQQDSLCDSADTNAV